MVCRSCGPVLLALFAMIATHAATAAPIAPQGVTYVPAPASANALARKELRSVLSGDKGRFARLLSAGIEAHGKVLIGVFMTQAFDASGFLAPGILTDGDAKFPLGGKGGVVVTAKLLAVTEDSQIASFLPLFYRVYKPTNKVKIRKLTKSEMQLVWFYIGWNLSEPVYTVTEGKEKLVFEFGRAGKSLLWMEDISRPCFRIRVGSDQLPCMCQTVIHKGNNYENVFQRLKSCHADKESER